MDEISTGISGYGAAVLNRIVVGSTMIVSLIARV
jgi:hypothetical protein